MLNLLSSNNQWQGMDRKYKLVYFATLVLVEQGSCILIRLIDCAQEEYCEGLPGLLMHLLPGACFDSGLAIR